MVAGEVVEVVTTIGPQKHLLGVKILHGKAKGVKFDITQIIASKFTIGDEILENVRRQKNMVEIKRFRRKVSSTSGKHMEARAITDYNMTSVRRQKGTKQGQGTWITGDIRSSALINDPFAVGVKAEP